MTLGTTIFGLAVLACIVTLLIIVFRLKSNISKINKEMAEMRDVLLKQIIDETTARKAQDDKLYYLMTSQFDVLSGRETQYEQRQR